MALTGLGVMAAMGGREVYGDGRFAPVLRVRAIMVMEIGVVMLQAYIFGMLFGVLMGLIKHAH